MNSNMAAGTSTYRDTAHAFGRRQAQQLCTPASGPTTEQHLAIGHRDLSSCWQSSKMQHRTLLADALHYPLHRAWVVMDSTPVHALHGSWAVAGQWNPHPSTELESMWWAMYHSDTCQLFWQLHWWHGMPARSLRKHMYNWNCCTVQHPLTEAFAAAPAQFLLGTTLHALLPCKVYAARAREDTLHGLHHMRSVSCVLEQILAVRWPCCASWLCIEYVHASPHSII